MTTLATALPAAAVAPFQSAEALALASSRAALPAQWRGRTVVLQGDNLARLGQVRRLLDTHPQARMTLFLDGTDAVLFDIARHENAAARGARPALSKGITS